MFSRTVLIVLAGLLFAGQASAGGKLRLYAIDCGRAEFKDLSRFADTGEYDGVAGTLMVSCFLVQHPKGVLLWDAGWGDRFHAAPEGTLIPQFPRLRVFVPTTLSSQLAQLNLKLDEIDLFAFSHGHPDHLGGASALPHATWIVNRREQDWIKASPAVARTPAESIAAMDQAKKIEIDGDYDVFGDGSVRILKAPGHTPGHQVLLLSLPRSGTMVLSGDLYHTSANRDAKRVPALNVQRADTLASFDRIERILSNRKGRLVIQHSVEDFASLPKFPLYLD